MATAPEVFGENVEPPAFTREEMMSVQRRHRPPESLHALTTLLVGLDPVDPVPLERVVLPHDLPVTRTGGIVGSLGLRVPARGGWLLAVSIGDC